MVTVAVPGFDELVLPGNITTLDEFRRWRHSDGVPEKLKAHFFDGQLWVETMGEEFFSHNQVKAAIYTTLAVIIDQEGLGLFSPDGMLLINEEAELASEPDGLFVSNEAFTSGRVSTAAGQRGQATELVGTPDLVVEIVSRSSVRKDTDRLMQSYHRAGIPEYWLIDARRGPIQFRILRGEAGGYVAAPTDGEWVESALFSREFRLIRSEPQPGIVRYKLETR